MPRFFFNTVDGARVRDIEGTDLPDNRAARVYAIRFLGDLLSENPDFLWDGRDFRVEITDRHGQVVCTVLALAIDYAA